MDNEQWTNPAKFPELDRDWVRRTATDFDFDWTGWSLAEN
jgi:hypothetical protein